MTRIWWSSSHVDSQPRVRRHAVRVRYTEYKDSAAQVPAVVHVHQGDPVLNPAHNIMEIKVATSDEHECSATTVRTW